jgi:hypothetical protein
VEDPRSYRCHLAAFTLLVTASLAAQEAKPEVPDPLKLVTQAEAMLTKKEVEDAVLLLWDTQDLLLSLPSNPIHDAAWLSARHLLLENDPREAQRRAVFASVAKQQVELATAYRLKKWLDVADTCLAVADQYDRDVGAKERAAVLAARPKPKAPVAPAKPEAAAVKQPVPLLQRPNAEFAAGNWRVVEDTLECQAAAEDHNEWVTNTSHADHEVVVEFRSVDAKKDHNAILAVGLAIREGTQNYSGYRLGAAFDAKGGDYSLTLWAVRGMKVDVIGNTFLKVAAPPDGFHRLSLQVHGQRLRAQLDDGKPIEVGVGEEVRGRVGLLQGLAQTTTCAVQFRNLRVQPLPADQPSDDELRAEAANANQNAISKAVDEAKELIAKKQPEAASMRLREALGRVEEMPAGVLRTNLAQTVATMLAQADPLWPRRKKAGQTIAAELLVLAGEYAKAGWARTALTVGEDAVRFDEEAVEPRLALLREAVLAWNAAQATARAAELAPPPDDGTVMREWFAKGRNLDSNGPGFTFEGASARGDIGPSVGIEWLPHPLAKPTAKASVHVRLPANRTMAGLYFDVVDMTHHGLVFLERRATGLRLHAYQKLANKWVPLLNRDIAMDAWRLDAWHKITVEADATGLVARCGTTTIKVPRNMLGRTTGLVGLYADNESKEPVTIELRAFQPGT